MGVNALRLAGRGRARRLPAGARVLLMALALAALLPACGSRRPAVPKDRSRPVVVRPSLPALGPVLDAYPLGTSGTRMDRLGGDPERSLHLLQAARPTNANDDPARTRRVYVLAGSGTAYVGERSYPARPGSTVVVSPGTPYTLHPEGGSTLVAIVYFEPPLSER